MLRLGLVSEEEHCQLFGNLQTILSLHEGLGLANNVCTSFSVAKIVCMYNIIVHVRTFMCLGVTVVYYIDCLIQVKKN